MPCGPYSRSGQLATLVRDQYWATSLSLFFRVVTVINGFNITSIGGRRRKSLSGSNLQDIEYIAFNLLYINNNNNYLYIRV